MSRGPGHLSTAIIEHLAAHPSQEFTIGELAAIAYPGVTLEKKHRVATARVVNKLAPERLKRREPAPEYTPDPATERRFAALHRACSWIDCNGDIATLTDLRYQLAAWRYTLAQSIALKRRYGE